MKKIKFVAIVFAFCLLFISCNTSKKADIVKITRDSFKTSFVLTNPKEIIIDSLLYPDCFNIMYDSIIVVQNNYKCEYLLELYSLNSLQSLGKFVKKGNGPGEMSSCRVSIHSSTNPVFTLEDRNKNFLYQVNLDSMIRKQKLYVEKKIHLINPNFNPYFNVISLDGKNYLGNNMWYMNDKEYTNSNKPFIYNSSAEAPNYNKLTFVGAVNGSILIPLKKEKRIIAADSHIDNIKILNDTLGLIKEISGPDFYTPTYVVAKNDYPGKFIDFGDHKSFKTYIGYTLTDKFVYLIYNGTDSYDPSKLTPVEVFKFDFEGNPISRYKLDRYLYSISIDTKNGYLYGTSKISYEESRVLIRYKLPD